MSPEERKRLGSGGDEFADVGDVALADGTTLACQDRRHSNRISSEGHELNFEAFAAAVNMYNGANIASFQAFAWNVGGKHNTLVFLNIHPSRG